VKPPNPSEEVLPHPEDLMDVPTISLQTGKKKISLVPFYNGQLLSSFIYLLLPLSLSLVTPLQFVLFEGEGVKIPATPYLVPFFTLIYLVLFYLLLPYNLDVPSYFTNRLRYCAA
jgi:hypothetical protein